MREGWYNLASTTEAVLGARLSVWVLVHMLEGNPVPANIYLPVRVITEETLDDEIAQGLEGKEYSPEGWVPGPVLGE
jgi:ABC-type sugar transport system substrate-binding protein